MHFSTWRRRQISAARETNGVRLESVHQGSDRLSVDRHVRAGQEGEGGEQKGSHSILAD